jgi:hypothetical protein
MPVSQLPQAPYRQDRKIFPTPLVGDVLFSEVRDCNRGNPFPEYGTPYPNANKWPNHKLVYIKPVDIERNEIFEFFYAAERENQDLYNFAFGNRVIGNREFRTVTRTYVTLRENFKPVDIEFGTAMPNVPEDKFGGVNYVFYDKEQQNTQQEELNALFVIEVHSYVEEAVLDEVLTLSTERQDPLPPKFRVLSPTTTTDELAEGSIETPVLTGDQLAATEDQINTNLKRKRTVSRSSAQNTSSLSGKQVTNDLQVANVVESIVPDGTTITTSALTVDGSVESLGNGQSVQRVITAPELFTAKSFSAQRPDPVPEKFRVLVPTESTEENEAGTAEMPVLSAGEFEETEQQVNVHVKRKRKTKRNITTLPKTLTQKSTTNEKQVATVKETLQNGDTSVAPSALVDVQSEALGDGTYVVREVTVPELFKAEAYSTQRPDPTPEKFRVAIPTTTTEESVVGNAAPPTLTDGDIQIEEQQQNKFVKRVRKTKRVAAALRTTLTQKSTTNEKQVATVKETLQKGDTSVAPSALKDVQSEALGDGTYVVREVTVPELFPAQSYGAQKRDNIPEKFQADTEITTESVNKTGKPFQPVLASGELERSNEQINEFVYREQVTKRMLLDTISMPTVERAYVEGTIVTVDEKLSNSAEIETGLSVSESVATPIGDGKFIVQTVKVKDEWPELKSSEYNYELNAQVERIERFVAPPENFGEENVQYRAINKDRVLRVEEKPPLQALDNYNMSFPVRVDVQLPNVLKKISVEWIEDVAEGEWDTRWSGNSSGDNVSLSGTENANVDSACTVRPELIVEIEQPWGSDIPATAYIFFVKGAGNSGMQISDSSIKSKLGNLAGGGIQDWPVFKPKSHTILLKGMKMVITAKASASASYSATRSSNSRDSTVGDGVSYDINSSFNSVTIPPTIHENIEIGNSGDKVKSVTANCLVGWNAYGGLPSVSAAANFTKDVTGSVYPKSLSATSQAEIPNSGFYLMKCTVEPYKWGYAKCAAVVLDASKLV